MVEDTLKYSSSLTPYSCLHTSRAAKYSFICTARVACVTGWQWQAAAGGLETVGGGGGQAER